MARRLFELLLRAYPESLRRTRGPDMWATFETHLREARRKGAIAVLALWVREVAAACVALRPPALPRFEFAVMEVKHAFRSIVQAPGFSLVVVVTLAIGVGANAAIFSVVNGVLLRPLPYSESERLVAVIGRFLPESGFDFPEFLISEPEVLDLQEQSETLVDVAAFSADYGVTLTGDTEPERLLAASVSHELFAALRIDPLLGRTFTETEDRPDGADVVVIGRHLWERRFGSDPAILGETIEANGTTQQVIGVVPPGALFASPDVELYFPLAIDPGIDRTERGGHYLRAVARLAPGATFEAARAELAVVMERWKEKYPEIHTGHFLFLRPLLDDVVNDLRPALLVLMAAVGALLLVACANVSNLFLARSEGRHRQTAVRIALGAGRLRLLGQALSESALLCLSGGLAGIVLARIAIDALLAIDPEVIPKGRSVAIDAPVLFVTLAVITVASFVVAALPVLAAREMTFLGVLREASRGAGPSRRGASFRRALVVAEIASSLTLVIAAGLVVKSLSNLLSEDPGFRAESVLAAQLSLPAATYGDPKRATTFLEELLSGARGIPGVVEVSSVSNLPLADTAPNNDIVIEGRPEPAPGEPTPAGKMVVASPGYFELLDVPLLRGRFIEASDREGALPVAVISRQMAEAFWPGDDPIGKRFNPLFGDEPLLTVVGIVGDVKYQGLGDAPRGAWYFPVQQSARIADWTARFQRLLLRVEGDPLAVVASLRALVRSKDPDLMLGEIRTLEDVARRSVASSRFTATLLSAFASVALALGASGIFAVIAFSVARRRKELGIRAALGATRSKLVALVAREGIALCAIGIVLGTLASLALTRALGSLLYGVSPTDATLFVTVVFGVAAVALLASYLPARRVSGIDPVETLRGE